MFDITVSWTKSRWHCGFVEATIYKV